MTEPALLTDFPCRGIGPGFPKLPAASWPHVQCWRRVFAHENPIPLRDEASHRGHKLIWQFWRPEIQAELQQEPTRPLGPLHRDWLTHL